VILAQALDASAARGFPVLSILVLLPAAGAVAVALLPRRRPELVKAAAVLTSVAAAALGGWMLVEYETGVDGFQFVDNKEWIADFGISWHLGVDGISLFLVVLTLFLFPIAIAAVDPGHDDKSYYGWLLLLEAGCIGTFLALDLFVFFVMFEIVLVPMYFLIGGWGHGRKVYAALKFFLYTMFGSALMLVGILATVILTARETGNAVTFDLVQIAESQSLAATTGRWIFLAFAVAFAVKTPLFPLHTWLPDAHTEAPTAGSVILAGVMLKLGTYGFVRFGLYLFPEAAEYFAPLMVTLGVIGILYAAVVATMQKDLKRLVAYSSVAHLGFIVLGTFAFTTQGLQGSVLQMVNHGLSTGALFLLVGMIYDRRHTREIAAFGGLQKAAPVMAFVFTVVMLSSIGLPGLNGFVGEFLILLGSFLTRQWWAVVGAAGVIFAALYLLWAYQRVFHGPIEGDNVGFRDMNRWELLYMAPLLAGIVFLGVYPKPVLERIEPAVDQLVAHLEEHTDFREPDVADRGSEPDPEDEPTAIGNGGVGNGGLGDGEHP